MGTTPNRKLPYPEPADPINAGADNIKALALAVDLAIPRVSAGVATIQVNNSNVGSVTVTHPVGRFTGAGPFTVATCVNVSSWITNTSGPNANAVVISVSKPGTAVTAALLVHYLSIQL